VRQARAGGEFANAFAKAFLKPFGKAGGNDRRVTFE
jgi:hypothetical protein